MADKYSASTVRTETEFMLSWVANNGKLFEKQYNEFFTDHPSADWKTSAQVRPGYLVLVAVRKEPVDNSNPRR